MNLLPLSVPTRRLLLLLPLLGCTLWGAPKTELPSEPLQTAPLTAFERQRASVRLQMSRIAEAQARRSAPSARATLEKQRAAAEKQRRSVERQMLAVRPEPAVYTAAAYTAAAYTAAAYTAAAYTAPARAVAAATWTGAAEAGCERIPPPQISNYLESVAERESLDPDLLHVVIAQESSFFPCAVSHKGAMGMMQLMPGTAADLGVTNPFDAKENIDGGARYLGYLLQRFGGDLRLALAAYNAGPTRVDNYRGVPPIPETVDYVSRIMGRLPAMPKPAPVPALPGTT